MIISFVLALLRHYTYIDSTKVPPRKIYFSRRNLKRPSEKIDIPKWMATEPDILCCRISGGEVFVCLEKS